MVDANGGDMEAMAMKPSNEVTFREKRFKTRPSLLTRLFEESDACALRHLLAAAFALLFLGTAVKDAFEHANPFHHLWLVLWNFSFFPQTMLFWVMMALSALLPYIVLKQWSEIPAEKVSLTSSLLLIVAYVFYIVGVFFAAVFFIFKMNLNCACTFIVTCENTRIVMKVHSFVRESVPRAIKAKLAAYDASEKKEDQNSFPRVEQLFYFFFCPSFVYRDEYPRTASCDWATVFCYFVQIILTILCTNLVYIQMVIPRFESVDYALVGVDFIATSVVPCILPGMLCLLLLFYGLLHCWLNMFAEMLRFGDRQFYVNWWNSKNMAEYYRNWNLVVHDWLYAYVYRDVALLFGGGKRGLQISQMAVFFLSAAFHEYWFGVALRMFYPVMFVLYFIFGGLFYVVSRFIKSGVVWNTLMWGNLLIGTGMFVAFYAQEWYSRSRCPPTFDSALLDILVPRHWFCSQNAFR